MESGVTGRVIKKALITSALTRDWINHEQTSKVNYLHFTTMLMIF